MRKALLFATTLAWLLGLPLAGPARAEDPWLARIDEATRACARGDYGTAERWLLDALDALPADEATGRRARDTRHRLGLVYMHQGDAARAEESLLAALGEGEQADPLLDDPSARLGYLHTLANLYESQGEWGSAEARRHQILEIAAHSRMTAGSIAVVTANMGRFWARRGDRPQAIAWHERALRLLERDGGPPELAAEQYEALAVLHKEAGRLGESAEAYAAALTLWYGLDRPVSFVFAKTLAGHAELLWRSGEHEAALDELGSALELADALLGDDPPALRDFLGTYVAFLTQLGESTRDHGADADL